MSSQPGHVSQTATVSTPSGPYRTMSTMPRFAAISPRWAAVSRTAGSGQLSPDAVPVAHDTVFVLRRTAAASEAACARGGNAAFVWNQVGVMPSPCA